LYLVRTWLPTSMAARSKAWVCGRSLVGIVGSNSDGGMNVCLLLGVVCCQVEVSVRADHLSRGVLPTVVCLSVIVNPRQWRGFGPLGVIAPW
jgi:hypothetical protein